MRRYCDSCRFCGFRSRSDTCFGIIRTLISVLAGHPFRRHPDTHFGHSDTSYPELAAHSSRDIGLWHASYAQTYLERDVRTLRQVGDLVQFQSFLRALATRSAQLLNLADLARDLGVAVNTAKAWLSVLEATYQFVVLR